MTHTEKAQEKDWREEFEQKFGAYTERRNYLHAPMKQALLTFISSLIHKVYDEGYNAGYERIMHEMSKNSGEISGRQELSL